jgi:hypothetical protein
MNHPIHDEIELEVVYSLYKNILNKRTKEIEEKFDCEVYAKRTFKLEGITSVAQTFNQDHKIERAFCEVYDKYTNQSYKVKMSYNKLQEIRNQQMPNIGFRL